MPDAALLAAAGGLLPPGVAIASADPRRLHPLMPGEDLPGATPARLAEFSAGRDAARRALARLGPGRGAVPAAAPAAIPQGADRAPLWPAGVAGSITHSRSLCLAAVTRAHAGLGIDLEEDEPLADELAALVLSAGERRRLALLPDPGRAAMLVFSAKEAAYKAQYARSRRLLEFDAIEIRLSGQGFAARLRVAAGPLPAGTVIAGRHARVAGHVLTACAIPS